MCGALEKGCWRPAVVLCCGASSVNSYECVGGEKDKAQLGCGKETLRARQSFCRQSSVSVPVGYRNDFRFSFWWRYLNL